MSDYVKTGGSLKLKGGSKLGPQEKKKKKKSKSSTSQKLRDDDDQRGGSARDSDEEDPRRSNSPVVGSSSSSSTHLVGGKTDAQRRFEEVQRKRLLEKAAKAATRTHKDRVAEFNEKLENLSEHYDIPKVGPG